MPCWVSSLRQRLQRRGAPRHVGGVQDQPGRDGSTRPGVQRMLARDQRVDVVELDAEQRPPPAAPAPSRTGWRRAPDRRRSSRWRRDRRTRLRATSSRARASSRVGSYAAEQVAWSRCSAATSRGCAGPFSVAPSEKPRLRTPASASVILSNCASLSAVGLAGRILLAAEGHELLQHGARRVADDDVVARQARQRVLEGAQVGEACRPCRRAGRSRPR